MPDTRADTLLRSMKGIERFTLRRAWRDLTDDELYWEPVADSWGVRRRSECRTLTPFGLGEWVVDFDTTVVMAAIRDDAAEPLTTIGWLLWHIGSLPQRLTELDFLDGEHSFASGWTSPYVADHRVFTSAADAVDAMRDGWHALERALEGTTDDALAQPFREYSYTPDPGPLTYGAAAIAGALNEITHHGSQICTLRDLYRITNGGPLSRR